MIERITTHLTKHLIGELPGERAHVEMAPIHRPLPQEAKKWNDTRYSGVLILLYPEGENVNTALMRRPDYGGVHSGQISFPGGRREDFDESILHTALREAKEEMNIQQNEVEVLGQLSELYIPPSKSLVTPVIGVSKTRPEFIPEKREVAEIIEANIFQLLHDDLFGKTEIVTSNYILKEVPVINYNGHVIWGATAMMLNELKWLMKDF